MGTDSDADRLWTTTAENSRPPSTLTLYSGNLRKVPTTSYSSLAMN